MSTGATDSGWYYAKRGGPPGQQVGPINWKDLVSRSESGALSPDDVVWNEQLGDWRSASQIPGLFSAPAAAAPAGYVAPAGYAAARPRKSNLLAWLIPLVVVILIGAGVGAYFGFWYHKGGTFAQNEGEILLEASGVAGPDSFAGEQFVALGPSTTLKIPNPQVTLPQATVPLVTTTTTGATTTSQEASTTTASTAETGDRVGSLSGGHAGALRRIQEQGDRGQGRRAYLPGAGIPRRQPPSARRLTAIRPFAGAVATQ